MTLEREKNDESEIEFHGGGLENRPSVGEHRVGRYFSSISAFLSEYPPRVSPENC
jgi:hypothetical protein